MAITFKKKKAIELIEETESPSTDLTTTNREKEKLAVEYESVFEMAMDGIIKVNVKGFVESCNEAFLKITGYPRKEIIGKHFTRLPTIRMRDVPQYVKIVASILKGEKITPFTFTWVDKKGNDRLGEIHAALVKVNGHNDGIIAVLWDITDREKTAAALQESENNLRAYLESAPDGVFICDEKGTLLYGNKKAGELIEYDREELEDKSFLQMNLLPPEYMAKATNILALSIMGKPTGPDEFELITRNGNRIWVEITSTPMTENGKKIALCFMRDIYERKQSEEKLKQSFEKLQKTVDGTINTIAMIAEKRDPYTAGHQRRVAKLASAIAVEMRLSEEQVETIRVAGILHDIGKVDVPTEILCKTDQLSDIEFSLIKTHPEVGHEILKTLELPWEICPIILEHHERLDGSGYPNGIYGKNICLGARVLAVADVVEALSSHRPYRPALGISKAIEEISQNRGSLYDADVVDACIRLINKKGYTLE
jgi:PAS domain S-box-containing protein/putative nucleotidyltransferase with HDIG domain